MHTRSGVRMLESHRLGVVLKAPSHHDDGKEGRLRTNCKRQLLTTSDDERKSANHFGEGMRVGGEALYHSDDGIRQIRKTGHSSFFPRLYFCVCL